MHAGPIVFSRAMQYYGVQVIIIKLTWLMAGLLVFQTTVRL